MVRSVKLSVLVIVKTTSHVTTSMVCVTTDVTMDGLEKTVQKNVQKVDLDQTVCTTVVDTAWVMSHVIEQLEDATPAVKRDILENCVTQAVNMGHLVQDVEISVVKIV